MASVKLDAHPDADFLERTGSENLGARLWRLPPGSANTLHRHVRQEEFYFLLEGLGRMRIGGETLTVPKHGGVLVGQEQLRQVFNDTDAETLWLIVGAPAKWLHTTPPAATEPAWLKSGAETVVGTAAAASRDFVIGAGGRLVEFGLALFLLFILLRDGRDLLRRTLPFIPLKDEDREALLAQIGSTTRALFYGSGVTALVQGAMVGIGFAVTGLPAPVVFGSVGAFLATAPQLQRPIPSQPRVSAPDRFRHRR